MSFNTDSIITAISDHTRRAALIAEHSGIKIPAAYTKERDRWAAWCAGDQPTPMDTLLAAYQAGKTIEELAPLRAAATATANTTPVEAAAVRNAPATHVLAALRTAYAPIKIKAYDGVRDAFNSAAAEFTRLAQIIDPETDAKNLVSADEDTRRAWLEAELIAGKLDTLATVLADAALLAGASVKGEPAMIGLLTDPKSAHRRRVYEAWNSNGRCGRWSAFIALNVDLRAADLDEHRPYREPLPIEKRQVHNGIGVRMVDVDPEDADYTPAKRDPRDVLAV